MRFAEVFLRLGCSLVAWMVTYTWVVWLAALPAMGCGPDGDEMHLLLLGLAPLACAMALMLRLTRPFEDIHRMLRWLALPVALLLVPAVRNVWGILRQSTLDGLAICEAGPAAAWQSAWAPVQFAAMLVIVAILLWSFREVRFTSGGNRDKRTT